MSQFIYNRNICHAHYLNESDSSLDPTKAFCHRMCRGLVGLYFSTSWWQFHSPSIKRMSRTTVEKISLNRNIKML